MHRMSCIPVCRTVLDVLTKIPSSLAFHCFRETAANFAGAASAVQLFHIFSFLFVCYGEPLLLVSSFCAPAPLLGVSSERLW